VRKMKKNGKQEGLGVWLILLTLWAVVATILLVGTTTKINELNASGCLCKIIAQQPTHTSPIYQQIRMCHYNYCVKYENGNKKCFLEELKPDEPQTIPPHSFRTVFYYECYDTIARED